MFARNKKWRTLVEDLDERGRRCWAATEAIALGRDGIASVSEATGISDRTIRNGIKEIQSDVRLPKGYQRAKGGGRKLLEFHQPGIVEAIESLVEPTERGDPQSSLRWTCKSIANLVGELREQGYRVGQAHPHHCRPWGKQRVSKSTLEIRTSNVC